MLRERFVSKVSGIYCILNKVNGKRYIGQTVDFSKRLSGHRCALIKGVHSCVHLQHAYDLYGIDAFDFFVLERCELDVIDSREDFWITHYRSNKGEYGYNVRTSPVTNRGVRLSDKTKLLMSLSHRHKKSPESVKKSADTRRGTKRTDQQKRRIADKRKVTDEQVVRIILRLLEFKQWTMREIAQATGATPQYVSRIRNRSLDWATDLTPASDSELPIMPNKERKKGTVLSVPRKRITEDIAREIVRLNRAEGWGAHKCAKHLGVSKASAEAIIRGKVAWVRKAGIYD